MSLVVALLAPGMTACPLPLARTEAVSAPIAGRFLRDDGRPLANLEVAVSTEWQEGGCAKAALRTRTDSSGAFRLAGSAKHYEVTWFVPNLDRAAPRYRLCAGVGDTLRVAYTGYGSLAAAAEPDSVACVAWEWEAHARVTCAGRAERAVVTGGSWTDAAAGDGGDGFYRLFLTEEPTRVKGYDRNRPQDRPYVYVQWVEIRRRTAAAAQGDGAPYRVRATVSLPLDRNKVWAIDDAEVWRRGGRWVASLHGYKHAFMNDVARTEMIFELGAPGQASKVAGP